MRNRQKDILFFSGEEWTQFSQRPQSIAIEFARRGYRCFYIEPLLSMGKILTSLDALMPARPAQVSEDLFRFRPLLSLSYFRGSATACMDKFIFRMWLARLFRQYAIRSDAIIYISLPYWWNNLIDRAAFPSSKIIFDCIDDCRVYSRNDKVLKVMENAELALAKAADIVTASALPLHRKLKVQSSAIYLPNAIDTEIFRSEEYPHISHGANPVFGFVGSLFHWIDFGVFSKIAVLWPESAVVLIGPTNRQKEIDRLRLNHRNIHYLGPKPYGEIPGYIQSFDICLNPKTIDEIGNNMNPLKLYEYLSLGKPIVSSRTAEMEGYADLLYLYNSIEDLEPAILRALNESENPELKKKRILFAKANTWQARVDIIEKLLGSTQ